MPFRVGRARHAVDVRKWARMKHRRKLVVGLGALAFSMGMVVTAGTANAGTNGTDYVYANGVPVGKVWFNSDGDNFTIYD